MADGGQELALHLAGALQLFGPLFQLGIECQHAAIGVFQLGVGLAEIAARCLQLRHGRQQITVLGEYLVDQCLRLGGRQLGRQPGRVRDPVAARKVLGEFDARSLAGRAVDIERVHQATRADDTDAHAGARDVTAIEDALQVGDTRPLVAKHHHQLLLGHLAVEHETERAAAAVAYRVAGDFRDGRRNEVLRLRVEPQEPRDLAGALPGRHHVLLGGQRDREDGSAHQAARFSTSTVESSRPRLASRYSTAAIRLAWRAASPG